jgi:lipase maturation factor 1
LSTESSTTPSSSYGRAAWLFLRLLGLVYLAAFWSLAIQVSGLVGPDGIIPSGLSDATLHGLCGGGIVLAVLLFGGLAPAIVLPLLWIDYLYLSFQCVEFLSYQWDTLLLEVGFIAIVSAPWVWRERMNRLEDPPRIVLWLFRWLLFRLMFASGAVKLSSADVTWRTLTALSFHFETQPIPTPIAWYVHRLPAGALEVMTAMTLAIELGAPFLMLGPRRLRIAGFVLLAGLQAIIALTGNYAFFNLLSIALSIWLLDDQALGRWGTVTDARAAVSRNRKAIAIGAAVITIPVSMFLFAGSMRLELPGAVFVEPIADVVMPLRVVNRYGLFAVMTTDRPEIVIEGSEDGQTWREYEFKYKAGDVRRRPPWAAPHQPRLDWQMWFAALGDYPTEPWFHDFCDRLLEADPAVLKLLASDPFGGHKPQLLRAVLYRYRFSDWTTGHRDGVWWTRERIGDYSPVLSHGSP